MFLLPLPLVALWRCWRQQPRYAAGGLLAGGVCGLAWFVPTARLSRGFAAMASLDRTQMMSALRTTSVFFGAPPPVHAGMLVDMCLFFALALVPLALPLAVRAFSPQDSHVPLPPLILLGAWWAAPLFARGQWTVAVVAVGLVAGYFPYGRFLNPAAPTAVYQILKASPRLPGLLESAQRQIRGLIDGLPGRPEEKLIICLLDRTEAPNLRTVTDEYPDVTWADAAGHVPESVRSIAWLCNGAGLPAEVRARFPAARRVAGNTLFSFWSAELSGPPPSGSVFPAARPRLAPFRACLRP